MTTHNATIRLIEIPATLADANAQDFIDMVRVRNEVYRELTGHSDDAISAEELLPHFQPNEYTKRYMHIVELDGEVVGRVGINISLESAAHTAEVFVELLQRVWGLGIGRDAHAIAEQIVRDNGRTIIQAWATHLEDDGVERLSSPTGFGTVPRDHAARFLLAQGYTLGQVERRSVLPLTEPITLLADVEADALAHSGDYEVVTWIHPTPDDLIDGYAVVKARMSTDPPSGDLTFDEETWDADRVRATEAKFAGTTTVQVTAARHKQTGELAAFNELAIGPDHTHVTDQWDTLVLKEHRGHRLGALVKTAGIRAWQERFPDSPRIVTYNAEENRPMLSINEAIGFVPTEYNGAWQKRLAPTGDE